MKCCNNDHDPPKRTTELTHEFKCSEEDDRVGPGVEVRNIGHGPPQKRMTELIQVLCATLFMTPQKRMTELTQVLKCATLVMTLLGRG